MLELTFNNQTIEVTAEKGGVIVIKAERGEYRDKVWNGEIKEEDLPEALFYAMAAPSNGVMTTTWEEWRQLFDTAGDPDNYDTPEEYNEAVYNDRKDFDHEQQAAADWRKVSDIDPCDIWAYCEKTYGF